MEGEISIAMSCREGGVEWRTGDRRQPIKDLISQVCIRSHKGLLLVYKQINGFTHANREGTATCPWCWPSAGSLQGIPPYRMVHLWNLATDRFIRFIHAFLLSCFDFHPNSLQWPSLSSFASQDDVMSPSGPGCSTDWVLALSQWPTELGDSKVHGARIT